MESIHDAVAEKIAAIEAEMRSIGFWQEKPLPEEKYRFKQAFAMDTMTFDQWLQFVFVPRVKSIIEGRGEFPADSQVAVQAIREFDTVPEAGKLGELLSEFDKLIIHAGEHASARAMRHH